MSYSDVECVESFAVVSVSRFIIIKVNYDRIKPVIDECNLGGSL